MITITFPEWMAWLLVGLFILMAIRDALGIYLHWLKRKLIKQGVFPKEQI